MTPDNPSPNTQPPDQGSELSTAPQGVLATIGRTLLWCVPITLLVFTWIVLLSRPQSQQTPPDTIHWQSDLRQSAAISNVTSKPLLLYFTADWCPPCQVMQEQVYPDPRVNQTIRSGFIPVKVDVSSQDSPGQSLAVRYQVEVIPTLIVVDKAQNTIARHEGMLWAQDLVQWLNEAGSKARQAKENTPR